jgi:hypothetical protein
MQGKDIFCGASSSEKDKIFKEILDIIYKNKGEVESDSDIYKTVGRQEREFFNRNSN